MIFFVKLFKFTKFSKNNCKVTFAENVFNLVKNLNQALNL